MSSLNPWYDLFLRFNRRLLSILRHLKPTLSTNESHILAGINASPDITPGSLAKQLHVEKSTLSRALSGLVTKGLVHIETSVQDGRVKVLNLTPAGSVLLAQDSRIRDEEVRLTLEPLSAPEQIRLQNYLAHLADGLKLDAVDIGISDHPVKREIRRLSRGMGFLGPSCLGTGTPVEECQALHLISDTKEGIFFSVLAKSLPYDPSYVSRLVSELAFRKWVKKSKKTDDKRGVQFLATQSGLSKEAALEKKANQFVSALVDDLSASDRDDFKRLLSKFVETEWAPRASKPDDTLSVRRLKRPTDLQRARAFLVEMLVLERRHEKLGPELLSGEHGVWAAYRGKSMVGLVEAMEAGCDLKALTACVKEEPQGRGLVFRQLLRKMLHQNQSDQITFSGELLPQLRAWGLTVKGDPKSTQTISARDLANY